MTSFGGGSPGGSVDCARFQCHRPTNGPLSAHAAPAASATQKPMITVVPRIRFIASSRLLQACQELLTLSSFSLVMSTVGMRATDGKDLRKNPLIVFTHAPRGYVPRRVRADSTSPGGRRASCIARLRHRDPETPHGDRGHGGQRQEGRVVTDTLDDESADNVAERSPEAGRRADGAVGEVESPRPPREIGDHQDRGDPDDAGTNAVGKPTRAQTGGS